MAGASGRARFAGVTIGYISDKPSGSMPPEVVAVGYYDKKDNYQDCEFDKSRLLAYSYQYSTKDNSWTEKCKATEVVTNGFTDTGTKGDDVQNPIAVAAVAADGVKSQEYLFISGSMYQIGTVDGNSGCLSWKARIRAMTAGWAADSSTTAVFWTMPSAILTATSRAWNRYTTLSTASRRPSTSSF